ncbi:MAG: MotA/TolQ/ExbB proton channel family protein [Planctomycetota bacterium]
MPTIWESVLGVMQRGGVVMWPLLLLSVASAAIAFERVWFFVVQNHPAQVAKVRRLAERLRGGDAAGARAMVEADGTVYGRAVAAMIEAGLPAGEAATAEAVEAQRGRLERFLPTLSTIITAAPMLGILGTVIGIITSFEALGGPGDGAAGAAAATDPRLVSSGIAEALLSTAAGLTVSLLALFPYNAFRAQVDRTLSRLEMLGQSAERAGTGEAKAAPSQSAGAGDGGAAGAGGSA